MFFNTEDQRQLEQSDYGASRSENLGGFTMAHTNYVNPNEVNDKMIIVKAVVEAKETDGCCTVENDRRMAFHLKHPDSDVIRYDRDHVTCACGMGCHFTTPVPEVPISVGDFKALTELTVGEAVYDDEIEHYRLIDKLLKERSYSETLEKDKVNVIICESELASSKGDGRYEERMKAANDAFEKFAAQFKLLADAASKFSDELTKGVGNINFDKFKETDKEVEFFND